jgi:DNA uptake protein ComE-like DNA-binding protein
MRPLRPLLLLALSAALAYAQTPATPLDLNTATPQELNALPGFGPAYTRRVLAARPYTAKNQLVTRGVLPQGAYNRIAALIIAHRAQPSNPQPSK